MTIPRHRGAGDLAQSLTREACIAEAGAAWARACAEQDELLPRAAAEAAWRPGGPSVDELEARIIARRQPAQAAS